MNDPLRDRLQAAIAPLQLLEVEGVGGMGEIYLARDASLRRTLAVKVLRSELVADAEAKARCLREARGVAPVSEEPLFDAMVHQVERLHAVLPDSAAALPMQALFIAPELLRWMGVSAALLRNPRLDACWAFALRFSR